MLDSTGVCKPSPDIFGVKLNGGIGIDLHVDTWKETKGDRKPWNSKTLWNDPNIFKFPEQCFHFPAGPQDSSLPMKSSGPPASSTQATVTSVSSPLTTSATQSILSISTVTPFNPKNSAATSPASISAVWSASAYSHGTASHGTAVSAGSTTPT